MDSCYFWSENHLLSGPQHPFNAPLKSKFIQKVTVLNTLQDFSGNEPMSNLRRLLEESVAVRARLVSSSCRTCYKSADKSCPHARIGILFSGGLDSTVIAALVDR